MIVEALARAAKRAERAFDILAGKPAPFAEAWLARARPGDELVRIDTAFEEGGLMLAVADACRHHQFRCNLGDLPGFLIRIGDDDDIVLGPGGANLVDDIAKAGCFLAVEFEDRARLHRPFQRFGQRRWIEGRDPALIIDEAQLRNFTPACISHRPFAGRRAGEGAVMHQEKHTVPALGDVDLHHRDAGIEGVLERLDRVLRETGGRAAAMGGDQDAAIFAHTIEELGQIPPA